MRAGATLKLDNGDEVRVNVDLDDLHRNEIIVRRVAPAKAKPRSGFLAAVDAHLATAKRHAAGTTDRLLADERAEPSAVRRRGGC